MFQGIAAAGGMEHAETSRFVFPQPAVPSEISDFHDLWIDFLRCRYW
jgi:hypothetical protein